MSKLSMRRRRQALPLGLVLCAGVAFGAVWALPTSGAASAPIDDGSGIEAETETDGAASVATVQPTLRDLTIGHEATGSITAASSLTVLSPADGTLVSIVETGTAVGPGDVIAVVDDQPVSVIEGTIPMWRDMGVGDEGTDVLQLETALVALGFDADGNVTVDDEYTSATASMVADWQASIGADDTGTVGRNDIVVLAAPMTVSGVEVAAGALVSQGSNLVGLDSLDQIVTASIPVADAVTLSVGDAVDLRLPDRSTLTGEIMSLTLGTDASVRIAEIAIATTPEADETGETDEVDAASIQVNAQLFEGVTVDVSWDQIIATDVLTIPADTFRHLDDGSYVVDVLADDGTIVSLAVEPGRQVGTFVEVAALPTDAKIIQP